jgi:hypothetical protein
MTARTSTSHKDAGPNKAGFVFGDAATAGEKPNVVLDLTELKPYLVAYNNGEGRKQVRLVFKAPGSPTVFILQEKISGSYVATSGTEWFSKAFGAKLSEKGLEVAKDAGPEGAAQV